MNYFFKLLATQSSFHDETGATVLEYSVLASCIAAIAAFGIGNLGQTMAGLYGRAVDQIGALF